VGDRGRVFAYNRSRGSVFRRPFVAHVVVTAASDATIEAGKHHRSLVGGFTGCDADAPDAPRAMMD